MNLFIEFNENETRHLKTLEEGESFEKAQNPLLLRVDSQGDILTVNISMINSFLMNSGIRLAAEIKKDEVETGKKIRFPFERKEEN